VAGSHASSPMRPAIAGFRFPADVIVLAVRWYLRFGLSYRDLEELLTERGVEVDHLTIYRWVVRFTPLLAEAARPCRHRVGAVGADECAGWGSWWPSSRLRGRRPPPRPGWTRDKLTSVGAAAAVAAAPSTAVAPTHERPPRTPAGAPELVPVAVT
jgi:hypothetical protein